ncbi:MAG TPA: branched-chain amino acid ABC transporter permease [Anaeromyxobacteraceae bacterium]|nr:branched-chain amino acid ABC transporter permease [Anaeromyxobacteraceae bacterium]
MTGRAAALGWLAGLLALAVLPFLVKNPFLVHVVILVYMWTVLGAAWNVLGGFAGQVSFGHAALFGIGAYTTIILFLKAGVAPWWGILWGGLAAAVGSVPVGLICFRLRGPYFSLATLAVAELAKLVALNWEWLTNGPVGFLITTLPPLTILGHAVNWEAKAPFYFLAALLLLVALASTAWLSRSRLGAFLVAIRENEDAAEAVGIDTVRAKVLTLALSAFLAGLGGGFYAFYFRYVDPDAVLNIGLSMEMVFIAMVGGLGTVGGPFIGAVFLTTIGEVVRERFQVGHLIFYGLFMMIVIRFLPEGIWGRARIAWARVRAGAHRHGAA